MEAGAAAAAAAGAGMGLFAYNRANYQLDQKIHYARFTAGLNMAIAQTEMYRSDIESLTELTAARQDCYHGIAAMGITVITALYAAGRLGFHTAAPPAWLLGLEFVNIAGCYLFMGLTLWFAMHASMRAQTASTHMLTRFVRLPIPSQGMLDKARKFLASYEEQPLSEIFRVPFMQHPKVGPELEPSHGEEVEIDEAARRRSRHSEDLPAWYRKERATDNINTIDSVETMMPLAARGSAPEHFEAYRELQMEWFPYDVYARVSIFLAFMHLTHCWCYMQIGHQLQENRAVFTCALVVLPMFVLQNLMLTLDIIPQGVPLHRLGPVALWVAYVAAAIEYKRWYTPEAQIAGFVLVYIAYALHIIYTVQLIRLCSPSPEAPPMAEVPGASWWPAEWRLPLAFQHAIWVVAPPRKLERGHHDLAGDLRARQLGRAVEVQHTASAEERRADVHRALGKQGESPAWFSVRVGLWALLLAWLFLVAGFSVEIAYQGTPTPSFMLAYGLPQHTRDPRYRDPKPGRDEPTEVGTGGAEAGPAKHIHATAHSVHRRLNGLDLTGVARPEIAARLRELLPYLQRLSNPSPEDQAFPHPAAAPRAAAAPAPPPRRPFVRWPATRFEPRLLACGGGGGAAVLALARDGRGALVGAAEDGLELNATSLILAGVAAHGKLVAATWDELGLLLLTETGTFLECLAGAAGATTWQCAALAGAKLPITQDGKPFAGSAAISRGRTALRAAVVFQGEASVAVYSRAHAEEQAPWLLAGEVRVAASAAAAAFAHAGEALLLARADGAVDHLRMADGSLSAASPAASASPGHSWVAACQLGSGAVARLSVNPFGSDIEEPKLLLG